MYNVAAAIYLVSAVLFCLYVWWVSRTWVGIFKSCTRLWVAIVLFIPSQVEDSTEALAPAFMKVLFTFLTDDWVEAKQYATPLVAALAIATAVILCVSFVNWVRRPKDETE